MRWGCEVARGWRRLSGGEGLSREERAAVTARGVGVLLAVLCASGSVRGSVAVVCGVVVCCACVPRCPSYAPERHLGAGMGSSSVEGFTAASGLRQQARMGFPAGG